MDRNTATESARTETGDKAFEAGTVRTKKEYLCALMVDEQRWRWNGCHALPWVK